MFAQTARNIARRFTGIHPHFKGLTGIKAFNSKFRPDECHRAYKRGYVKELVWYVCHEHRFL